MEKKGFIVDRTDATKAFVDYMSEHGQTAQVLNALTDGYGGPYDMIYANAVLVHFTSRQIVKVLRRAHKSLKHDGLFSFSVKIGDGTSWSNAKLNLPRFFVYWREQPLRDLLSEAHFDVVFWKESKTGHNSENWYHVIARRL
jgi:predicted TPR repeat methyltransferase